VCSMLSVSLDWLFLIALSVFSNIYLLQTYIIVPDVITDMILEG
jgi:hypothetical protein